MIDARFTKTCCDGAYRLVDLYCEECGEPLEETHYRACIVATLALAAGVEWWLAGTNVLVAFRWSEVFMLQALLLLFVYPAAKVIHKVRAPERAVVREMATVFADRWSRMLLVGAWVYVILGMAKVSSFARVAASTNLVGPADAALRRALVQTSLAGYAIVSVLVLLSQGPRFFDLRIANTLSPRERRA